MNSNRSNRLITAVIKITQLNNQAQHLGLNAPSTIILSDNYHNLRLIYKITEDSKMISLLFTDDHKYTNDNYPRAILIQRLKRNL